MFNFNLGLSIIQFKYSYVLWNQLTKVLQPMQVLSLSIELDGRWGYYNLMLFVSFSPIYGLSLPCVLSSSIELEAFHQYILWAFLVSDFSTQLQLHGSTLKNITDTYFAIQSSSPFYSGCVFFMWQHFLLDFSMGVFALFGFQHGFCLQPNCDHNLQKMNRHFAFEYWMF